VANLAPQKIETVPIGALKHHPKNPRKGDVKSITESIEHNGFYGVVVAQKSTGYVLAGNHRMMAAKAAGLDSLPVAYVDVDDATALKILLADNRTNDLATYDNKELAELLADVSNTIGLDGTGFDEAFLDGLITSMSKAPTIAEAFGNLCQDESREIQQMAFVLHDSQIAIVKQALDIALATHSQSEVNQNKNGNALARICEVFLEC
jgi:ParB-like chromosome segregation protein Spo0J